ncbi:MAG: hypothetical protein KY476_07070 [Planctomycetes bacterium]|nr:hypothetical protein [Planctomycetota bacterium]
MRADNGDDPDARFYSELRRRGLFSLAEGELLERLTRPRIGANDRVELTLELSRTFSEHARFAAPDEQRELWERADGVVAELLKNASVPRRRELEVQRAVLWIHRGEFLASLIESFPHDAHGRDKARGVLERGLDLLKAQEEQLKIEHRKAAAGAGSGNDTDAAELRRLLDAVRFALGVGLIELAELAPKGTADRQGSLLDAEAWLKQLAGGAAAAELVLQSRLLLARAARLRGDFPLADRLLGQLEGEQVPRELADRVVAERVRLLLDQGQAPDAASRLSAHRRRYRFVAGELHFLDVRALAANWKLAVSRGEAALATDLLAALDASVERAAAEAGGYWAWRCETVRDQVREVQEYGPELAALVQTARAAFAAGDLDGAHAGYTAAFDLAREQNCAAAAFEFGHTRASIELKRGRHLKAAADLVDLSRHYPEDPRAAEAHLLGAWCLGRVYEASPSRENREAYTRALEEHRSRFASSDTAHEAAWMLGLLEESRLQRTRALELYRTIPPAHRRGPTAQAAIGRCHVAVVEHLKHLETQAGDAANVQAIVERRREFEREAVEELSGFARSWKPPLTDAQAEVAVHLARLLMGGEAPDYAAADSWLAQVLSGRGVPQSSDPASSDSAVVSRRQTLLHRTTQLRIISLAGQAKYNEAAALIERTTASSPAELLSVLDGLSRAAEGASSTIRFRIAQLQLRAAGELEGRRNELSAAERVMLDRSLAEAHTTAGQPQKALAIYETLVEASPRDVGLRRELADQLVRCGTRECLEKARQHWRKLEAAEAPGSESWLEARYHVARTALLLEEREECRRLVTITRLLYPDLGGERLSGLFEELERELAGGGRR